MRLELVRPLFELLSEHWKGLTGVGSIDLLVLFFSGMCYFQWGGISYLEWTRLFVLEAILSGLAVIAVELLVIVLLDDLIKKKRLEYIS